MKNGVDIEQAGFRKNATDKYIPNESCWGRVTKGKGNWRISLISSLSKQMEKSVLGEEMKHKMKEMRYKIISLSLGNINTFSLRF